MAEDADYAGDVMLDAEDMAIAAHIILTQLSVSLDPETLTRLRSNLDSWLHRLENPHVYMQPNAITENGRDARLRAWVRWFRDNLPA